LPRIVASTEEFSCRIVPDIVVPVLSFGGMSLSIRLDTASLSPGLRPGRMLLVSSPPPISGVSSSLSAAMATSPIAFNPMVVKPIRSPAVSDPEEIFELTLLAKSKYSTAM